MTNTKDLFNDAFFIGFDNIFNKLNSQITNTSNYPPYNIIKTDNDTYVIEIAVAGFNEEDLDITLHNGQLTVKGETKPLENISYIHRGIAARNFTRIFTLADTVEVLGAQIFNGTLQIRLQNIIPEIKKPKKIAIGLETPTINLL